jgi:tyrosyl-tRNA synthetase
MAGDVYTDLEARGLVYQASSEGLRDLLRDQSLTVYIGFDPTADSLHVGSMLQLITLCRLQQAGHKVIGLVGGGTGMIGDPSFKADERSLLSMEQLELNLAGIRAQIEQMLGTENAVVVNNADWLRNLPLLDFLRDIGKHFSVNQMIVRDSVRTRLETREQGISYTEFTYMLLQAYDFLALHDRYACNLQLGGRDQWGNIVSGIDLIRRLRNVDVHGLTLPLVTKADGTKFGKSEEGNVWLDPEKTSPYQFYQFWLNADDQEVINYLNYFTFLSHAEIEELSGEVSTNPAGRVAQRTLAEQVTRHLHGDDAVVRAQRVSQALFDKHADYRELSAQELGDAFQGAPTTAYDAERLGGEDAKLAAVVAEVELYPSRGRARKDIPQGAVSVNNVAITDADYTLTQDDVLPGGYIVLRKGKKNYHILRLNND